MDAQQAQAPTDVAGAVVEGRTSLGIELGSTRIKAVLIGADHAPLASGEHDWENQLVGGSWTYSLDDVWDGVRRCFASLAAAVGERYGVRLETVGALGVSAMMHGYLAFDADDELLVPFRTWRNTGTGRAAERLSRELGPNIPHRWSVAHLYQAVLDDEPHVGRVAYLTTLAGYVHWRLTGERVIGVGDASGMFPIDSATRDYDQELLGRFDTLTAGSRLPARLGELLPVVRTAGEPAGRLTEAGAALLDPTGALRPGLPLCPPEGDAGTGMVATNSAAPRTGNVSAGTSIFAMVVLEEPLRRVHRELDLVTTPAGDAVAMVHCNNGASELSAWVGLFVEAAAALGVEADRRTIFSTLVRQALDGDADCGGLTAYNFLSGEPVVELDEGRPLFLRTPDSVFTLANFFRAQLYASIATLRIGMDVLQRDEGVRLETLYAHGGLFATAGVAQRFLAAAVGTPVAVGSTAAEGGAWGIAVLAAYLQRASEVDLAGFLAREVFAGSHLDTVEPDPADAAGFEAFLTRFVAALPAERAAVATSPTRARTAATPRA